MVAHKASKCSTSQKRTANMDLHIVTLPIYTHTQSSLEAALESPSCTFVEALAPPSFFSASCDFLYPCNIGCVVNSMHRNTILLPWGFQGLGFGRANGSIIQNASKPFLHVQAGAGKITEETCPTSTTLAGVVSTKSLSFSSCMPPVTESHLCSPIITCPSLDFIQAQLKFVIC